MRRGSFIAIFIVLSFTSVSTAQSFRDIVVDKDDEGKMLAEFLHQQENKYGIEFICDERKMRSYTLTGVTEKQRFADYFEDHFANFRMIRFSDKVTFIIDRSITDNYALKKENFLLFPIKPGDEFVLRGRVSDALNSDPLVGARVYVPEVQTGAISDENGKFSIEVVSDGILQADVQYVGYEPNHYIIGFSQLGTQQQLSAALLPLSTELESVTVTADRLDKNVTGKITGVESLSISTMKTVPAFMGELDPIRSLTTLPGVSTVGELASGFNVRGGEVGQNLIMQEGAMIYNPSHLFGFFSAFNPDMVSNVTLYKGGGPANFGGRISSVLDVSLRNGNATKHTVSGGLGLVSSRLTLEGPIVQNRSSYLIGGRFSYCNWLVHATDNISLRNSAANFRDLTGKIFHTVNENNYITLTGYYSYDDFKLATDSVFAWSTTNLSLKWDHTFNDKMHSALTVSASTYFSRVHSISEIEGFNYHNAVRNVRVKYDITRVAQDESSWSAGVESIGTQLEPGKLTPDEGVENLVPQDMPDQRSVESAIFFQWNKNLSAKWSLAAGVRYGYFLRFGPEEIYRFDYNEMNGRYPSISDTVVYRAGQTIARYGGVEPRVSLRYLVSGNSSVKASYYRGFQYLHLISNTSSTTPQDYWITSGPYLQPERGDQYSLGYFQNLRNNQYELSAEGFYRNIDHAVDYVEGADITLNPALEAGLMQGKGLAYGVEMLVKRSSGRVNGWLSYTFSRSLRRFNRMSNGVTINRGEYYPSAFDQPHHVALVLNYVFGPRVVLSANFTYSTGRPITIPVSKFSYDVYLSVLNYSERNEYRIPDYHRLDLSLTIKDKPRRNKRFSSEWVFSLFNAYSRKNAYSIYFDRYGTASKLSILGSIFPSVNYNFRF